MADSFFIKALKRIGNAIIDLSLAAIIGSVAVAALAAVTAIWIALRSNPQEKWFYFAAGVLICALIFLVISVVLIAHRLRHSVPMSLALAQDTVQASDSTPAETRLRLQFNVGSQLPLALEHANVFRWYVLNLWEIQADSAGHEASRRNVSTTIFMVFEFPVFIKQFRVDAGGARLPHFEVKDSSNRHAIIVFNGTLEGMVLDIQPLHL